ALLSSRIPPIYPLRVYSARAAQMPGSIRNNANDIVTSPVTDPVCGMRVDPHATSHRETHHGRTYYFCSADCRAKFAADPEKYLRKQSGAPAPVPEGTIYTCPMHPEIRKIGPGNCPICGMALEPVIATEAGPNPELVDMTRRFWIGVVLTV